MLISCQEMTFTYIGKTKDIRRILQEKNSGEGSNTTESIHLRPYEIFAYICGFNNKNTLTMNVEKEWKNKRDHLIRNGENYVK